MDRLYSAFTVFLSLLVEAMPFLLLGVLFSSGLLVWLGERPLDLRFPKNPLLGALAGSAIGFLFPVCECGNVPVARRLLVQRVPVAVAIGFLLAAPTVNPIAIWSTWVAFRGQPEVPLLRVLFSLTIATVMGAIFSWQADPKALLQPALARRLEAARPSRSPVSQAAKAAPELGTAAALLQGGTFLLGEADTAPAPLDASLLNTDRLQLFSSNVVQELRELGGMLVLGSAIAAAIQAFAPREAAIALGQGPITSILAMMLLAALVSVCSTVDAFFALSFAATFTTGSLLAFLVFGPAIDLKSVGLLLSIFRPRVVLYLFVLTAQLVFLLSWLYAYFA